MPYKNVVFFETIDSTNSYMKEHFKELNHLDVVTSKIQTKGRGRSDHKWMSDEGNLYFSYILKNIDHNQVFKELSTISVSLVNVLREYGVNAWIKYPNDIIVKNRKIAGILIETRISQDLNFMIVGVGLNINQIDFKDLKLNATSIHLETKNMYDVKDVLYQILDEKEKPHTFTDYVEYSMILGKRIQYMNQNYLVDDILEDGRLLLSGKEKIYVSPNEISLEEIYK